MLSPKFRIWERLQKKKKKINVFNQQMARKKKNNNKKEREMFQIKRDSGDIQLNAIYRPCLDPVLNSPAIEKKK